MTGDLTSGEPATADPAVPDAASARTARPRTYDQPAAYQSMPSGPLDPDRSFYDAVASAERTLTREFEIPVRSGHAWEVSAGSIVRISAIEGPQVGDLNLWNLHNPRERFWAARTRQLQRASMTTYDRFWSTLPHLRPMATVIGDSLAEHPDAEVIHDLLGTRCDPYVNRMLTGEDFDYHCHSNLTRAIHGHGLTEYDVHDVLNVFQFAGLNEKREYFMDACPTQPGDYFEFFAEIDLLCALSTCPGGDLSVHMWGPDAATTEEQLEHCHPLGVQVFAVEEEALGAWRPPETATYRGRRGRHGLVATPHPGRGSRLP
ncbi:urea carboxylase-associated family protein [Nesterenkonia sp. DZ6]|uniref:urea carboxylase-associated family protein n=1 Tax=Nesterenkonia sp. DZ6 TaxID=2901229 RepID=UPI001F4C60CF|nr:urea carboxylase-associated family protein [Nesterenkonia sp. DZ6]MCH8559955.1 urea carboxylase-associated family protein [Nesterenkonia sp. DZ6]